MSKLTLPVDLKMQFENLREPTDVVDENGRSIGRFFPEGKLDQISRPVSDEELRRRIAANERTYSTAEVLQQLGTL